MSYTIQIKRAEEWPEKYILADGEFGYDKKLNILKIGDGHTWWCKLPAIQSGGASGTGRGIVEIKKTSTSGLIDTYTIYYTDSTTSTFEIANGAQGPAGPRGEKGDAFVYEDFTSEQLESLRGPQGKSAYEVAVENGYEGDEVPWLESLKGEQGPQGPAGANGDTPIKGTDYWTPTDRQSIIDEFQAVSYGEQTLDAEQKAQARKNIEDIPTFNTFIGSVNKIAALGGGKNFRTLGFYSAYDGAGTEYVTVNENSISSKDIVVPLSIFASNSSLFFRPAKIDHSNYTNIEVELYGLQRFGFKRYKKEDYDEKADSEKNKYPINHEATESGVDYYYCYSAENATRNSNIINKILEHIPLGYTLLFNCGHYFFKSGFGTTQSYNIKGVNTNAIGNEDGIPLGAYLHFPALENNAKAIAIRRGTISDIGIIGDTSRYNLSIIRGIEPELIETPSGTTYGIYLDQPNGFAIQNVRINNFTYGIYSNAPTNSIIDQCHIRKCQTGISVAHDQKITNIQVHSCMVGIELRGPLCSATNIRGDSIGKHLIHCWEGKCLLSNLDADYCLGSIIHYGLDDGVTRWFHLGQAINVTGRCATRYPLLRTEAKQNTSNASWDYQYTADIPFDFTGKDYEYCSFVSIASGSQVFGGYLDLINIKANPFDKNYYEDDTAKRYVHSNAILCIGGVDVNSKYKNSSINNVIIKCFVPSYANATYISEQMLYSWTNPTDNIYAGNAQNGHITDFDGNTFENIILITPQGQITSTRKKSVNNGARKITILSETIKDIYTRFNGQDLLIEQAGQKVNSFEAILTQSEVIPGTINLNLNDEEQLDGTGTTYTKAYLSQTTGEQMNPSWANEYCTWSTKQYIPVIGGKQIAIFYTNEPWVIKNSTSNASALTLVQYDENKTVLSVGWHVIYPYNRILADSNVSESSCYPKLLDNTKYIRLGYYNQGLDPKAMYDSSGRCIIKVAVYYKEDAIALAKEIEFNGREDVWNPQLYVNYKGLREYVVDSENMRLSSPNGTIFILRVTDDGSLYASKVSN